MASWLSSMFGRKPVAPALGRGPQGPGAQLASPLKPQAASITAAAMSPLDVSHTFSVIGDDDRTKVERLSQKPWCAICYLVCDFPNGRFAGTGWLIDGTTLVTAAHNLWNPPANPDEPNRAVGAARSLTVTPAYWHRGGGGSFGTLVSRRYAYDERWQIKPDPERRHYDYGMVFLDPPGFRIPFVFGMYALKPEDWSQDMWLNCAGYPKDLNLSFVTASGRARPNSSGSAFLGSRQEMVTYDIDTGGGQSGGPVFWCNAAGEEFYVLAVHTQGIGLAAGLNAGVRITDGMIRTLRHWQASPGIHGPQFGL